LTARCLRWWAAGEMLAPGDYMRLRRANNVPESQLSTTCSNSVRVGLTCERSHAIEASAGGRILGASLVRKFRGVIRDIPCIKNEKSSLKDLLRYPFYPGYDVAPV